MAYEIPALVMTFKAAADLSAKQWYFVKQSAEDTVNVCSAATDVPIGVLLNKPDAANKSAEVGVLGIFKVSSDAALSVGDLIGTSGDGQADAKTPGSDTTEYIVGQVLSATNTAGGLATCAINCLNPVRAA